MTTLKVGQDLNIPEAKNRWFKIGDAPNGGRHVTGGPIDPNPFCFIFACAGIIDNSPTNPMQSHLDTTVHVGDVVTIPNYGEFTVELDSDRYNVRLVPTGGKM